MYIIVNYNEKGAIQCKYSKEYNSSVFWCQKVNGGSRASDSKQSFGVKNLVQIQNKLEKKWTSSKVKRMYDCDDESKQMFVEFMKDCYAVCSE